MSDSESNFPKAVDSLEKWSRQHNVPGHEARERFVEFVILDCIAANDKLSSGLIFKGGNALRLFYKSVRSTTDLDFTVDSNEILDNEADLRKIMDWALRRSLQKHNLKTKCQRVKRNPKSLAATRPTYDIAVGYQFPWDYYFADFENPTRKVTSTINVEISFHDLVCESRPFALEGFGERRVRVCTLEDIIAEKLRALLQQPIRKRNRWQDAFDIARVWRDYGDRLDFGKVSKFLREKCRIRGIEPKAASYDENVRAMAEVDYERRGCEQAGSEFIPFEEAWRSVIDVVCRLNL